MADDYAAAAAAATPASEHSDASVSTSDNVLSAVEEKKILAEARRRMKHGMDADAADRSRASDELKFVWNHDNCQWDAEAKKVRKNRPMLTENRNPSFIRQATNDVRRSRPQIRVLPVDDQGDPYTAQIYEGLIRNIEANSRADMSYDQAVDLAAFCGRGYWKVSTKYQGDGFDQDIIVEPVPDPFSIVDDPDVVYPDKSDRKWAFEVEKVDREEFESEYGFEPETFEEASQVLGEDAKYWIDAKTVTVANYWRVVTEKSPIYMMTDGQTVPDPKAYAEQIIASQKAAVAMDANALYTLPPVPTVKQQRELVRRRVEWYCISGTRAISKGQWAGQYIPLIYTTCEQMKIDGRYSTKGMTYDAQDLTKANNYLLSAQIENIALTPKVPFIGPKGAFDTARAKWNSVNTENYAYIEYDVVTQDTGEPLPAPQRPPGVTAQPEIATVRAGVVDGQRSVVGLMGASLGDGGPEQSFVAIQARQARGDVAVFHVMDNLVRAVRYCGMVIVDLIPKVYDAKRVVRIINPDGEPMMQAINQMFVDATTGEQRMVNLAEGKYDVTVSAGPAFETQRQQTNATLVDLAGKVPALATVAPDLLAKALLPSGDGDKIAQRLLRTIDPAILGEGAPPAVKALQQQLQGMQQQMHDLSTQKDFFESELAKQKGLVEKSAIDNQTAQTKYQSEVAGLNVQLQQSHLDVQKKELEVEKAQLALLRAQMPAAPVHLPAAYPAHPQ